MKLILLLAFLLICPSTLNAQAPPEVLAMQSLPNAGQLYISYCSLTGTPCVKVKALCYGQCCDQEEADDMGYGCSGDIQGHIPYGFKYSAWSCQDFATGKVLQGKASKNYDHRDCHNPR